MLAFHVEAGAPCTVGCIEVPIEEAGGFGVMAVDDALRVNDFVEKSPTPPTMPGRPGLTHARMGSSIFDAPSTSVQIAPASASTVSNHAIGRAAGRDTGCQ